MSVADAALAAPPENLRVVAKGGNLFDSNTYTSGYTRSERRSRILLGGQPVKSIRFMYCNLYVQAGEKKWLEQSGR